MKSIVILKFLICAGIIAAATTMMGCGEDIPPQNLIVGAWESIQGATRKTVTYEKDGFWVMKTMAKGDKTESDVVTATVSGSWVLTSENALNLTVQEASGNTILVPGVLLSYSVDKLDQEKLQLRSTDDEVEVWKRVIEPEPSAGDQAPKTDKLAVSILMAPIVVNLAKDHPGEVDRYLFISLELMLADTSGIEFIHEIPAPPPPPDAPPPEDGQAAGPPPPQYEVHPKVRESILLFLSSLTYGQCNTYNKIYVQIQKLQNIIAPYMNGRLTEISVKGIKLFEKAQAFSEIPQFMPRPPAQPEAASENAALDAQTDNSGTKETAK